MRNAGDPNNFKYIFMFENVSCLKILDIVLTVQKWGERFMAVPQFINNLDFKCLLLSQNIWNLKEFFHSFDVEIMVEFPVFVAKVGSRIGW